MHTICICICSKRQGNYLRLFICIIVRVHCPVLSLQKYPVLPNNVININLKATEMVLVFSFLKKVAIFITVDFFWEKLCGEYKSLFSLITLITNSYYYGLILFSCPVSSTLLEHFYSPHVFSPKMNGEVPAGGYTSAEQLDIRQQNGLYVFVHFIWLTAKWLSSANVIRRITLPYLKK